jgi:pentose-5-phosphate-3-epimerase
MKISASVYSNKDKDLAQLVRELDAHGIDMFHIDCFDDSVFDDIKLIRNISSTPIDLHIINPEPAQFLPEIEKLGIEFVSIQYGAGVVIPPLPQYGKTQWGLAVTADVPLEAFKKSNQHFDFVLFMASEPGLSGKPFNRSVFQHIIAFRQMFPRMQIQVDGGINDQIAFVLRLLGVNSIVSGNYLLNREFLGVGMLNLHRTPAGGGDLNDLKISDFMTPVKYLPVLDKSALSLKSVLETIENSGQGFALVADGKKLHGIISNADLRRGFIRNLDNLDMFDVQQMVNTKPVSMQENESLPAMLHLLNNLNFIILFLPVTDDENNLKGVVLLNNLTRV